MVVLLRWVMLYRELVMVGVVGVMLGCVWYCGLCLLLW